MLILYNIRRYVMTEKYLNTVYEKIKTANVYDIAIKSPLEYAKKGYKYLSNLLENTDYEY